MLVENNALKFLLLTKAVLLYDFIFIFYPKYKCCLHVNQMIYPIFGLLEGMGYICYGNVFHLKGKKLDTIRIYNAVADITTIRKYIQKISNVLILLDSN